MAIKLNKQLYTGKDELTGSAGFAFFYLLKQLGNAIIGMLIELECECFPNKWNKGVDVYEPNRA